MTRRIPFNPHSFLTTHAPKSDVVFDMKHTGRYFAEGFFSWEATPVGLLHALKVNQQQYLNHYREMIGGIADTMLFYLIKNDHEFREDLGVSMHSIDKLAKESVLAQKKVDPTIFLNALPYDPKLANTLLTRKYKFDFRENYDNLSKLVTALRFSQRGNIFGEKRKIIKAGPETLEKTKQVHVAIERFLYDAQVESADQYSDIATKLNVVMDRIIDDLITRIINATPSTQSASRG